MIFRKYHRFFFLFLACALLTNIALDIISYHQLGKKKFTERSIVQTAENNLKLFELDSSLKKALVLSKEGDQTRSEQELASSLSLYFELKSLTTPSSPNFSEIEKLKPIENLDFKSMRQHSSSIDQLLTNLQRIQHQDMIRQISSQIDSTMTSYQTILIVTLFDLLLLIAFAFLWKSFDQARKKNERGLEMTLQSFQKTNMELQNLIEKKSRHLRSIVHDLKNPLGSIRGFSDLIQEETGDLASVAEMTQTIQRLSEHTLSLVNSLLSVEMSGPENPEAINILEVVDDVGMSLRPQLREKKQTLDLKKSEQEFLVNANQEKIWDAFANLLGNASKFSPPGSEITIDIFSEEENVIVEIEDQGPGFTNRDKEVMFKQIGSLSAKPTGHEKSHGMGLSIVHSVIESYGGQIEVTDSKHPPGARIRVCFPRVKDQDLNSLN